MKNGHKRTKKVSELPLYSGLTSLVSCDVVIGKLAHAILCGKPAVARIDTKTGSKCVCVKHTDVARKTGYTITPINK